MTQVEITNEMLSTFTKDQAKNSKLEILNRQAQINFTNINKPVENL